MFIVFGSEHLADLEQKYITLELESFNVDGQSKTAYCIVTAESISLGDYPDVERLRGLHQHFITNYNKGEYDQAMQALPHIKGKWGGELDSFYTIMEEKINAAMAAKVGVNESQ